MSLIAYEAVWELKLQPSEKLIMLCLAEHHNKDTEQCNPAYKTIAEETGLSKQHVIRLVAKLENDGVIAIKNATGCGSGNSNNYEISVLKGNTTLPLVIPETPQKVTQKVTSEQEKVTQCYPNRIEPIEPNTTPNGVAPKPPQSQKPEVNPAVKVFVEVTKKYVLNKTQMEIIDQRVGRSPPALEKWRKTVTAWMLNGYKVTNVSGMLDWFNGGIPERNGATNGPGTAGHRQTYKTKQNGRPLDPRAMDTTAIEREIADLERKLGARQNRPDLSPG